MLALAATAQTGSSSTRLPLESSFLLSLVPALTEMVYSQIALAALQRMNLLLHLQLVAPLKSLLHATDVLTSLTQEPEDQPIPATVLALTPRTLT